MISLKEIGAICGVSESTVSKALKDHPAVSAKTRQKVQAVAREHHYMPNANVQGIQSGRSYCIGVALNDFGDPYTGRILGAAQEVLHNEGYDLIVIPWDLMAGRNEGLFDRFACRRTDGVLLFPTAKIPEGKTIAQLKSLGGVVVQIDQIWDGEGFCYVGSDNFGGGKAAVEALSGCGCRRIGVIGYGCISSGSERQAGALAALEDMGFPLHESLFLDLASEKEGDEQSFLQICEYLSQDERPDGVFCFNDRIGALTVKAAHVLGLEVPDDIQVVGFGNLPVSSLMQPSLATFEQYPDRIGRRAAQMLLGRIGGDLTAEPLSSTIGVDIIMRGSVAR